MDHFVWSDTIRAALSSCLPCLRSPTPPLPTYRHADDLAVLLVDTDTEAETHSLHSNPGDHRRPRRPKPVTQSGHKLITLFGFNLFGRPAIQLPDDDEEERLRNLSTTRKRTRRTRDTSSSATLDPDAAPLDLSTIDGLPPGELQRRALVAAEEERRLKEERRRRRKERKELRKVARAMAISELENDEFEGYQGSCGAYPHLPQSFRGTPFNVSDSPGVGAQLDDLDIDTANADLGGEIYARRSTPETSNGSQSRSHSSQHAHQDLPLQRPKQGPLTSPSHSTTSPILPRRTKKSRSSASTFQSLSLPSPSPPPSSEADVVSSHEELIGSTEHRISAARLTEGVPGPGVRVKSRDAGVFLSRHEDV